jgi:hypothetical protein
MVPGLRSWCLIGLTGAKPTPNYDPIIRRFSGGGEGLKCGLSDVWILVLAGLLKSMGIPPANSVKSIATLKLVEKAKDHTWLAAPQFSTPTR